MSPTWLLPVLAVAAAAGCGLGPAEDVTLTEAERSQLDADLAAAEKLAAEMEAGWRAAVVAAAVRHEVGPRPDLGPCALTGSTPPRATAPAAGPDGTGGPDLEAFKRSAAAAEALLGASAEELVRAGDLEKAPSPRHRLLARKAEDLRADAERRARAKEAILRDAAALARKDFWTWDLVVVVASEAAPGRVAPESKTFEGGATLGQAFVYDYTTGAIACAGLFAATSSDRVDYVASPGDPLAARGAASFDLDARTLEAARASLRVAGPPAAASAPAAAPATAAAGAPATAPATTAPRP